MRAWLLVVVVMLACGDNGAALPTVADAPATCPASMPDPLDACSVDPNDVCRYGEFTTCSCTGHTWLCVSSNCPDGIPGADPVSCDASDTGCSYSDWEHDCDCTCVDTTGGRFWDCMGGTVGSICPMPPS
jgi:hypothetical protein